jgi:hypothetical protein
MSTGRRWRPSMQCHLGWCLAFRRDFPLESFTRGLASEDADKQTQRFIAVLARRPLTSCASRPSIALLSRPDHNALAPCREVDLSVLETHIVVFFGGHHVIADRSGGPQARSSPSARQGRSEAEWLDGDEDRRTISRRDGHRVRDRGARQLTRKAIEARWWKRGRRRRSSAAAVQNSERVRTHLYERNFPDEPDRRAQSRRESRGHRV